MDLRGMIEESLKWLLVHATQKREQFLNVCIVLEILIIHMANFPINIKGAHCAIIIIHNCSKYLVFPGHISCVKNISLSGFLHVFTKTR